MARITVADHSVEKRKYRSRDQKVRLAERVRLIRRPLPQQADHQLRRRLRPRVGKGMLPCRQILIGSAEGADESRSKYRRTQRIHQAKAHRLDELLRLLQGSNWFAVGAPLLGAQIQQFSIGHIFNLLESSRSPRRFSSRSPRRSFHGANRLLKNKWASPQ